MIFNKAEEIILHLKNRLECEFLAPCEKQIKKKNCKDEEKKALEEKIKYYQNLIFAIDVLTYTNKKDNKLWILVNRLGFTSIGTRLYEKQINNKKVIVDLDNKELRINDEIISKAEFRDFIEIMRVM